MSLLSPTSIAIIGASTTPGKVGHDILHNLKEQGFSGELYPVNPKHDEIQGLKAVQSVKEIRQPVDVAIVVIPAKYVPDALRECGDKGIKDIIIISAGFGEIHTEEGDRLEAEVAEIATQYKLNVVGPNCLGILRPTHGMNASFARKLPPAGNVALVSQSGAMAVAVMDSSSRLGIGFSSVVSIGNKTVMDESDLLELLADDPETKVIGFYLESIKHGRRFLETAARVARTKPIVLLKAGVSEHGQMAAASHTGALAGTDAGINAACEQAGLHRAHDTEEFLDLLMALSCQPELLSNNIAIVTNAGGPGILATDAAEAVHLEMPSLSERTSAELEKHLPQAASMKNPIDVVGDADTARYQAALTACGDDPKIDGLCVVLTPQVMTPCEEVAAAIVDWQKRYPMMPVITSFMGEDSIKEARKVLQKARIPCFETPERAVRVLASLQPVSNEGVAPVSAVNDARATKANEILEGYQGLIPQHAVDELFALYGLPVPEQHLATSEEEAVSIAEDIGYPVIAKISSPDILHKTDVGGIRAHLITEADVRQNYTEIMETVPTMRPDAEIRGVLIQQFLEAGHEFIIGAVRDNTFGHLVMAGLGGVYTELLSDTAFRIAPIDQNEGYRMLQELVSWKLLLGMRGDEQSDIHSVARILETVGHMVIECPQIKDIDLNPVLVKPDGIMVADAKVMIG